MSTSTCPRCDTLLKMSLSLDNIGISKQNTVQLNTETPLDITEDGDNDNIDTVNYELIISKIENDQIPTDDELISINIKDMIKTDYYKALKNKSQIKKKITMLIEDLSNTDVNSDCYLYCGNCGYNKKMDTGFVIATKYPKGASYENEFIDEDNIRNNILLGIYHRTAEFNCTNSSCPSNNGQVAEACIIRRPHSFKTMYVCAYPECGAIKSL